MSDVKTYALKCPGCGAALKVGQAVDSFACAYCGASVHVERGEGIVSLRLLTDAISNVQRGTDRTASELALKRLQSEVAVIEAQLEAAVSELKEADNKSDVVIGWVRSSGSALPSTRLDGVRFL